MKAQRSLRARALQWLAQREQSRSELRRKLLRHAVAEAEATAEAGLPPAEQAPVERIDALLDWLEAHNYLSQERFAESRVHARSSRFGNLRIRQELKQHQVTLSTEAAQALRESELQRARAVLERRFTAPPASPAERAKRARFLAGRGFSPEVIARLLRRDGAEQHATFDG
ncbi:MAG: recombination regulator RecX [Burkholderiales bacterium]